MEIKKGLELKKKVIMEELELSELYDIKRLIQKYKFNEIYNLGAQSFVKSSFNSPLIHIKCYWYFSFKDSEKQLEK